MKRCVNCGSIWVFKSKDENYLRECKKCKNKFETRNFDINEVSKIEIIESSFGKDNLVYTLDSKEGKFTISLANNFKDLTKETWDEIMNKLVHTYYIDSYDDAYIEKGVKDGLQWKVNIYGSNSEIIKKVVGSNKFPYSYDNLLKYLSTKVS